MTTTSAGDMGREKHGSWSLSRKAWITRAALAAQVFLLDRDWMGGAREFLMSMHHRGRKSGKPFATPVSYLQQGQDLLVLNSGGQSNWFKNVRHHGRAEVVVRGQRMHVRATPIEAPDEVEEVFEYFRAHSTKFQRTFGVAPDGPAERLRAAREKYRYMRLQPLEAESPGPMESADSPRSGEQAPQ